MSAGHAVCHWRFVATEIDESSAKRAREQVVRNGLTAAIRVVHVQPRAGCSISSSSAAKVVVPLDGDEADITTHPRPPHNPSAVAVERSALGTPSSTVADTPTLHTNTIVADAVRLAMQLYGATASSRDDTALASMSHPAVAFTMCNPPFFGSWAEAEASMLGNPKGLCTGAHTEMV